jgi:hypothetical protein
MLTQQKRWYQKFYPNENFIALIRRIAFRAVFEKRSFYLFECNLQTVKNKLTYICTASSNMSYKTICDNHALDDLTRNKAYSSLDTLETRRRLGKGAILFVIFVAGDLASWNWVGLTNQAKDSFNLYPYRVDFRNGEACIGGVWTDPKYRGGGVLGFSSDVIEEYLRQQGVTILRSITEVRSEAFKRLSKRLGSSYGYYISAEARYIRILGLQFWKETPLVESIQLQQKRKLEN